MKTCTVIIGDVLDHWKALFLDLSTLGVPRFTGLGGEQIPIIIFCEFGLEVGIFQLFIDGADFMSWDSIPITLGPGSW